MSEGVVLMKKHSGDHHARASKSKVTSSSKSCGNFDGNTTLTSELTHAKTVQYPSGLEITTSSSCSGSGEYYKRYDYDVMPVRDDVMTSQTSTDSGKGERILLTDSHLDKLVNNLSQDLNTDSSNNTLDSSIKFFRVTVEEIFSKFYNNMQDFELYKKKFHEILSKDQEQCVEEMEDFIKDMIHHIMSSESADFNSNSLSEFKNKVNVTKSASNICGKVEDLQCVMEAFKNENYPTESTSDDRGSESKREWKAKVNSSETFNIYLMSKNPCVKIKMNNNRHHLSEIQITDRSINQDLSKAPTSADNIKLVTEKLQLDMLESPNDTCDFVDREIPVKISFAKRNIHDDDVHNESQRSEKSFVAKLCSYLCTKLRKAANMGI